MESKILPVQNQDIKSQLRPYLKNWLWFAVSVFVFLTLAFLNIRYSIPQFAVKSKIQVLEDQSSNSELSAFKDLEILSGGGREIVDEIEILGSRTNFVQVVKELGLNKKIIELGHLRNTEQYLKPFFNVNFIESDSIIYNADIGFVITPKSETSFEYSLEEVDEIKTHAFGENFQTPIGDVIITPNVIDIQSLVNRNFLITIIPLASVAEDYQSETIINATDDLTSNIITLSLNDPIKQRGVDVLNTLIRFYNDNAVQDKKNIADRTSNFINERIADIYGDLSDVDQTAEEFKAGRGIANITAQTDVNLNIGAANQQELQNASIQLDIATSMKDLVDNQTGYEVLPANVGLADATIANTTARYNELALERKRLLESSNERNPIIVNLDQQLDGLKRSMQSSLNSVTNNLSLQVNSLSNQLSKINSRIYSAPKNERALRDITRQQQTTESLYLYLLQKREESQITFASASPKSKVIDRAYVVSDDPVSPKKPIIFLACLVLGLLVPFGFIYVKDLIDNKIHNRTQLEALVQDSVPILAELPKIPKKDNTLVRANERTVLAESLRILRTNLDYVLKSGNDDQGHKRKTIFVTSSVPGEGKTLVSSNLAMIFANAGKSVILIGADIRNPKINDFYSGRDVDKMKRISKNENNLGFTEYLVDKSLSPKDVVSSMLAHEQTIDVIFSGAIPPNPTELLMSDRTNDIFEWAKGKYDYVIVDTAPLMLVSDTLLISKHADQTLYITRAGMTETDVIAFPINLQREGKLKGLSFVVNGVKESELGYGGKYGYGYGQTRKKWYQLFG